MGLNMFVLINSSTNQLVIESGSKILEEHRPCVRLWTEQKHAEEFVKHNLLNADHIKVVPIDINRILPTSPQSNSSNSLYSIGKPGYKPYKEFESFAQAEEAALKESIDEVSRTIAIWEDSEIIAVFINGEMFDKRKG